MSIWMLCTYNELGFEEIIQMPDSISECDDIVGGYISTREDRYAM